MFIKEDNLMKSKVCMIGQQLIPNLEQYFPFQNISLLSHLIEICIKLLISKYLKLVICYYHKFVNNSRIIQNYIKNMVLLRYQNPKILKIKEHILIKQPNIQKIQLKGKSKSATLYQRLQINVKKLFAKKILVVKL